MRRTGLPRAETIDPLVFRSSRSSEAVYFLRYDGFVKIGYSATVAKRLTQHYRDAHRYDLAVKLVAAVNGSRLSEDRVHSYFARFNTGRSREDFRHVPEVTDYIRWLRAQYFTRAGDDPGVVGGIVDDVEVVADEGWLPSGDRRIEWVPDLLIPADDYGPRVLTADDYYTPADIIERVRDAMCGRITLDPASHAVANGTVRAERFYGKSEDGLRQRWDGRVWLNPPFAQWGDFAAKTCEELDTGRIEILIALVSTPALNTKYLRALLKRAAMLIIPLGRVTCWGPMASSAPTGHALLVFTALPQYRDAAIKAFPPDRFFILSPAEMA